jgi:hypothetical protein
MSTSLFPNVSKKLPSIAELAGTTIAPAVQSVLMRRGKEFPPRPRRKRGVEFTLRMEMHEGICEARLPPEVFAPSEPRCKPL